MEKHADVWDTPHLQLWARMICSGCHDGYDTATCIPAFTSTAPKKPRKGESLSEALTGASVAFAKAVSGSTPEKAVAQGVHHESPASTPGTSNAIMPGVSPGKAVDLSMKFMSSLCTYNSCMKMEFLIRRNL